MNFEYQNRFLILFFDIRTLTFFQVIMLIYLDETSPFYLLILDVINWFMFGHKLHIYWGGRTGLVVRASDSGSGDPGSILGRVGVLFS